MATSGSDKEKIPVKHFAMGIREWSMAA